MPSLPVHRREPRWARALWAGHPWLLTAVQPGNLASRLPEWTEGNAVQALVDGRSHLAALAEELRAAGRGDVVLLASWRAVPGELLADGGPPVSAALVGAALRGATVRLLLWRSHPAALGFTLGQHRDLARAVRAAGGQVVLDQRVRPLGCHHQKFVVIAGAAGQVAFVGGIDPARTRRDGPAHRGDRQVQSFNDAYGPTPAWHDAQLRLAGPAVHDVATVFGSDGPTPLRRPGGLGSASPTGCAGPLGRWNPYRHRRPGPRRPGRARCRCCRPIPERRPAYPFTPESERSVAWGYAKALARARRLVYVEDQYLWSPDVARIFAAALRRSPMLRLVAVVPRFIDSEGRLDAPASLLGRNSAWRTVLAAGGDREAGFPDYVHAKLTIVDDVWAAVGSANLCRRAWTHDSELSAAVLDERRDGREPLDPGGLGDGARTFARQLRLDLMREHLGRAEGDDADLLHPDAAAEALRRAANRLDAWHAGGCQGLRPPGRLRNHPRRHGPEWARWLITPVYDLAYDPDGRSWRMRTRREF